MVGSTSPTGRLLGETTGVLKKMVRVIMTNVVGIRFSGREKGNLPKGVPFINSAVIKNYLRLRRKLKKEGREAKDHAEKRFMKKTMDIISFGAMPKKKEA